MPAPTSAAGAAEGGPPRSELQELQLKAGQATDEVSKIYVMRNGLVNSSTSGTLLSNILMHNRGESKIVYRIGSWILRDFQNMCTYIHLIEIILYFF